MVLALVVGGITVGRFAVVDRLVIGLAVVGAAVDLRVAFGVVVSSAVVCGRLLVGLAVVVFLIVAVFRTVGGMLVVLSVVDWFVVGGWVEAWRVATLVELASNSVVGWSDGAVAGTNRDVGVGFAAVPVVASD